MPESRAAGGVQERRLRGDLSLFFARVIVRNSGPVRDASHTVDLAAARQNRLAQDCFAAEACQQRRDIPDARLDRRQSYQIALEFINDSKAIAPDGEALSRAQAI